MAAKKTRESLKAAKERRQKKIAVVGGIVLLVVLAIQVPRTLDMLGGPEPAAPQATAEAGSEATGGEDVGGLPASATPAAPQELPDPGVEPEPGEGQLVGFELFDSKDPFVQQVSEQQAQQQQAQQQTAGGSGAQTGTQSTGSSATQSSTPGSAVISVNGVEETVQVSGEFPQVDPAFRLVSVGDGFVRIGIAGGSLASGDATVTLRLGKTLSLVNTIDGTRYTLKLHSIG